MANKGSALIEVLISMAILAIGIFASATLILHGQKNLLLLEEDSSSRMIAESLFARLNAGQIDFSSDWQEKARAQLESDCATSACIKAAELSVSKYSAGAGAYRVNLIIETQSGRSIRYVCILSAKK